MKRRASTCFSQEENEWPRDLAAIRFFARSRMRSIGLERQTPITSATDFIANRPSAATTAAVAVFLTPWHVRAPP